MWWQKEKNIMYFLFFFTLLLTWIICGGPDFQFDLPVWYKKDGLSYLFRIKTLIENPWHTWNPDVGYPFGYNSLDYPDASIGTYLVWKIIGAVTRDIGVTMNLFFLFSFPIAAVASYWVFRKFKFSVPLSIFGALLFTFSPLHLLRLGHLNYMNIFMVPLFVWFAVRVYSDEPPFFSQKGNRNKREIITDTVLIILCSSFLVYYNIFASLIILISGISASLYRKSKYNVFSAGIIISIMVLNLTINLIPNFIYSSVSGPNPKKPVTRHWLGTELYSLKISSLLLPQREHRVEKLRKLTETYNHRSLAGSGDAAMGTLAAIGFLFLLFFLLFRFPDLFTHFNQLMSQLSVQLISLLLLSTMGGFSVLIALFIQMPIRAYSRVSIFIAFISITALLILIDYAFNKIKDSKTKPYYTYGALLFLLVIGYCDQTSFNYMRSQSSSYLLDKKFIKKIENTMPPGAPIYQLPYIQYPEGRSLVGGGSYYELLKGYLHSNDLKWSFPVMKGRKADYFFSNLSKEPVQKQLKVIKELGYQGVYIERTGYKDHGKNIEHKFNQVLGSPDIVSEDKTKVFYKL